MTLEEMKVTAALMKADFEVVSCQESKIAIAKARRELISKIEDEERRLTKQLRRIAIDGVETEIPESMSEFNGLKFHIHEGTLYLIEREKKLTKDEYPHLNSHTDTEFHWHSYAWIPNGGKFSKLCVRMLGGDRFGDRIFCSATHYKHPSDWHPYMETHLRIDSHFYRPYVEHILQEVTGWTLKQVMKR